MIDNLVLIGVGSNIEPEKNIRAASLQLQNKVQLLHKSSFNYTAPLLYSDQPQFLNGAFLVKTKLSRERLKKQLKIVEKKLGRIKRKNRNGPRRIDLDIVVYNREIVDPDLYQRPFLKKAVLELMPTLKQEWQVANQIRYRGELQKIIELIKTYGGDQITGIVGAGHWFCDQEGKSSEIKIIILLNHSADLELEKLKRQIQEHNLDQLDNVPLVLHQLAEDKFNQQVVDFDETNITLGEINPLNYYLPLSYDKSDNLILQREFCNCGGYLLKLKILWEEKQNTERDRYWWRFLRTYFYHRLVKLTPDKKSGVSLPFFNLKEYFQESTDDLIHKAFRYRYADVDITENEKLQFQNKVIEELQTDLK